MLDLEVMTVWKWKSKRACTIIKCILHSLHISILLKKCVEWVRMNLIIECTLSHTTLKYESESNKTKDMSLSYLRVVCGIQFQLNACRLKSTPPPSTGPFLFILSFWDLLMVVNTVRNRRSHSMDIEWGIRLKSNPNRIKIRFHRLFHTAYYHFSNEKWILIVWCHPIFVRKWGTELKFSASCD